MKKVFLPIFAVVALGFSVVSCSDDDPVTPDPTPEEGEEIVVSDPIEEDVTWTKDNVYILDGYVGVKKGATLTIEPGTIIKAEDDQGTAASALIVDRGSKLIANGTAEEPIIFTSVNDDIQPGETESSLDVFDSGYWGGVILLGNAPISAASQEGAIEGVPADLEYRYGGDDAADNSGSLKYVSIRFSGVALEADSEIQGLTMGGVGNGTTIENIEIFSNKDDGIEFFGGTVNVKNVVIYGLEDDGLDVDQAYSGTVDNAVIIFDENAAGSGLEIDGPEGDAAGSFTFRNLTIDMGGVEGRHIADFKDGATGTVENVLVINASANGGVVEVMESAQDQARNGDIVFADWTLALPEGKTIADMFTAPAAVDASIFLDAAVEGTEGGADLSVFDWTFTKSQGAF